MGETENEAGDDEADYESIPEAAIDKGSRSTWEGGSVSYDRRDGRHSERVKWPCRSAEACLPGSPC